jgi:hypothetical protein
MATLPARRVAPLSADRLVVKAREPGVIDRDQINRRYDRGTGWSAVTSPPSSISPERKVSLNAMSAT